MLQKLTISAVLLLASSLHSADAAACQLRQIYGTTAVPLTTTPATMGEYNTLGLPNTACAAACTACGGNTVGAEDGAGTGANFPTETVQAIGSGICPTINFATTVAGATATSCPGLGINAVATAPGLLFAAGVTGALTSSGIHCIAGDPVGCNDVVAVANVGHICNCLTANPNSCAYCGCNDLGVPTAAPTAIPTTAPTAATSSPTNGGAITASSDDSLSGGAIAGIVIGSVVGAALVIGAGVMIGSK